MFPISIIEAMASGIPFISTDVGCVKYLPGGVVVDKIDEMSYWLELLWNNEKVRSNLGAVGYNYARKYFTIENKVEQFDPNHKIGQIFDKFPMYSKSNNLYPLQFVHYLWHKTIHH